MDYMHQSGYVFQLKYINKVCMYVIYSVLIVIRSSIKIQYWLNYIPIEFICDTTVLKKKKNKILKLFLRN